MCNTHFLLLAALAFSLSLSTRSFTSFLGSAARQCSVRSTGFVHSDKHTVFSGKQCVSFNNIEINVKSVAMRFTQCIPGVLFSSAVFINISTTGIMYMHEFHAMFSQNICTLFFETIAHFVTTCVRTVLTVCVITRNLAPGKADSG